jgi:hypothetical protein
MNRKNIIVVVSPQLETWGNFKKLCKAKGWTYNSLKMLKYPIHHQGYEIHRVPFN